ncbi:MAG: hypothetical protein WA001_05200 [Patescibacteria group bacterium]
MSLQRIFESARKLGVPVIITDPAGREPLVVLPLEQFEALAGEGMVGQPPKASSKSPKKSKEELRVEEILAAQAMDIVEARMDEVASDLVAQGVEGSETPGITVEERFYLEPVDDEAGG